MFRFRAINKMGAEYNHYVRSEYVYEIREEGVERVVKSSVTIVYPDMDSLEIESVENASVLVKRWQECHGQ